MARTISAIAARRTAAGRRLPSGYPHDQASPALVVATAAAPHAATRHALPASHAFGRMRR